MPPIESQAAQVARAFSSILRQTIGDRIQDVIARNRAETWPDVCHSHDFTDANEVMEQAFHATGIPVHFTDSPAADFERFCTVWGRAWNIAKESEFSIS